MPPYLFVTAAELLLLLLFEQAINEQIITITKITINICFFIFYPHGNGVSLSSVLLVVITLIVLNSSMAQSGLIYFSFIVTPPFLKYALMNFLYFRQHHCLLKQRQQWSYNCELPYRNKNILHRFLYIPLLKLFD